MATAVREVSLPTLPALTAPQMAIVSLHERPERCWDIEGAPRSAKSWGVGFWIWQLAYRFPGIHIFYCRYKDDDLKTLREIWAKVASYFPAVLQPRWNPKEEAWDFPNGATRGDVFGGSRVYLSSLRVAEAQAAEAVHGKYKGKTLAVIICEEAQEIPKINYDGLKERLSQSATDLGEPRDYPLKIVLVHNAVNTDHWIAHEFPLGPDGACTKPHHAHLRADLYSNAQHLGAAVMAGYEADYPPGHPLRRTVIEGKRGLTRQGKPVYEHAFSRVRHVPSPAPSFVRMYPLLEGWDFGRQKPAVVWAQYVAHLARFVILGAVKGSEVFLEAFAPQVLAIRRRWFPYATQVQSWCDPTGATGNQGLEYTAVSVLRGLGVPVNPAKDPDSQRDANDLEVRDKAIQVMASYMLRTDVTGEPAFQMAPQCVELVREGEALVERPSDVLLTAFEAGYVYADRVPSDEKPNVSRPQKGTPYDDVMNGLEYIVIGAHIPSAPTESQIVRATASYQTAEARQALTARVAAQVAIRKAQRDTHPEDTRAVPGSRLRVPQRAGRRAFY